MQETRSCQLQGTHRATRFRLRLEHVHLQTALGQNDGRRQAIGSRADHASFMIHRRWSLVVESRHVTNAFLAAAAEAASIMNYSRGASAAGHSTTAIFPPGARSSVGA